MTRLQPALDAVLYLVKCGCGKDKCRNNRCSCRRAGLTCSNDETGEECDNVNMIENDSCDDETSDEQDNDSEEDEDNE